MKGNSLGNFSDKFTRKRTFSEWWSDHGGLNGVGFMAYSGFRIIFVVMLVFSVTYVLTSNNFYKEVSFQWLMSVLQNAPTLSMDWIYFQYPVLSDGSFLDFMRSWVNTLLSLFRPVLFIFQGVAQLFTYITYFVEILFGVSGG